MSPSNDQRVALRGALYRADGSDVVAALLSHTWGDVLQLVGDGLAMALAQGIYDARGIARRCVAELRDRGWEGDDELAGQLEASLGDHPSPLLRRLPVDLEELAGILEGDGVHGGGRIDVRTGEVWPQAAIDYARETGEEDPDDDDADRWLTVWCEGSNQGYRDMEAFIETVADDDRADRLSIAITGRGAFRRFKDLLDRWPGELERWHVYSGERQRGRARAWLAAVGYSPGPVTGLP